MTTFTHRHQVASWAPLHGGLRRDAEIDANPAGIYRLEPNGRIVIRGEYLEVIPDSRVVFTWGWENPSPGMPAVPAGTTQLEIDLFPKNGETHLRLTHRHLPPDAREPHELGGAHYLQRLKIVSESSEPRPDPYADPSVRHG